MHCLVNHSCTALNTFLYCTFIYFRTTYTDRIFLFVFFLLCILFSNLGACTALFGMCKLHSTETVLHLYTFCNACVLFAHCIFVRFVHCRCQNRRISGRGSRTVRLGSMVTGDGGHDVYPGSGPLYGGNTLLPALLILMNMSVTRVDLPRDRNG